MDFKGPLQKHPKQWYFLVVIDNFTKYVWGEVFQFKHAAPIVEYLHSLTMKETIPEVLQTDNGREFVNKVMTGMN